MVPHIMVGPLGHSTAAPGAGLGDEHRGWPAAVPSGSTSVHAGKPTGASAGGAAADTASAAEHDDRRLATLRAELALRGLELIDTAGGRYVVCMHAAAFKPWLAGIEVKP